MSNSGVVGVVILLSEKIMIKDKKEKRANK